MFDIYEKLKLTLTFLTPRSKTPISAGFREERASHKDIKHWCSPGNTDVQYNVGILHGHSSTCCIDVDNVELFWEWFFEHEDVFRKGKGDVNDDGELKDQRDLLGPAAVYKSGKPNRLKLLFHVSKPLTSLNLVYKGEHIGELRCVDNKGKTKYDVIPPSIHPDGTTYSWVYGIPEKLYPLPVWFERVWREQAEIGRAEASGISAYGSLAWFDKSVDVVEYATKVGYIDESEGHKDGKWMYSGSSSLGTGKGHGIQRLLTHGNKLYNHHESSGMTGRPISPSDILGWHLKNSEGQRLHGKLWVYTNTSVKQHIENSPEWAEELQRVNDDFMNGSQYKEWLHYREVKQGNILPTEFLESIAKEFYIRMHKQSMSLARGIVISMCAGLTAGKFSHHSQNTPCNLYMLFIGDSGSGKGSIDKFLNATVGVGIPIREMPHSGSALIGDLINCRNTTYIIDEYGSKLKNNDSNTKSTLVTLRECYGKYDSLLRQRSYSMAKEMSTKMEANLKKVVYCPVPNVALVTQWATVADALTDLDALSGDIARLTPYFLEEGDMQYDNVYKAHMPSNILLYIHSLSSIVDQSEKDKTNILVQETELARNLREQYYSDMNFNPGSMLHTIRNRRYENYIRMCCALAAFIRPDEPIITDDIANYCLAVMRKNGKRFDDEYLKRNVKENPFRKALDAVVKVLYENDGVLHKTVLRSKCSAYQNFTYNGSHGVEAQDRLLKEGCGQDLIYVDMIKQPSGQNKPFIKLASVEIEGERKEWL